MKGLQLIKSLKYFQVSIHAVRVMFRLVHACSRDAYRLIFYYLTFRFSSASSNCCDAFSNLKQTINLQAGHNETK